MGTRFGCGLEQCGCCMVLIDGVPEKCCTKPVWSVAGKPVITIEGLGTPERPHPLQQAFIDEQAGQCGYCLSGILISAKALLDKNPSPTRAEIAAALDDNICRCGSHNRILRAVEKAAAAHACGSEADERAPFPARSTTTRASIAGWRSRRPARSPSITGRVELGQGVLTAMAQIAADELDVAMARIAMRSGDTELTPNEGYTAGSQSIQFGGVAHAAGLRRRARAVSRPGGQSARLQRERAVHSRRQHPAQRRIDRPRLLDARRRGRSHVKATGSGARKPVADMKSIGAEQRAASTCRPRFSARPAFIHDMQLDGMVHARVVRQPNRGATHRRDRRSGDPPRRQGAGRIRAPRKLSRHRRRRRDCRRRSPRVAAVRPRHLAERRGADCDPAGGQLAAAAAGGRPRLSAHRSRRDPQGSSATRRPIRAAISRMPRSRRHAGSREFRDGHLTVWTHCQGVFPLRAALAKTLGLEPPHITVHHVQGSGCYGHNGADDAAADAAIIAMQMPGKPIRVRWRREEEFVYEPKTPAMIVKVRALLDDAGKPVDWTQEIWSPTHNLRGRAPAAICSARWRCPIRRPSRRRTTCRKPMAAAPPATPSRSTTSGQAHIHHLVHGDAGAHLRAARARRHAERVCARMLHRRTGRARRQGPGRNTGSSITADQRARAVIEKVAAMARWNAGEPGGSRPRPRHRLCALQEPRRLLRRAWSNSTSTRKSA